MAQPAACTNQDRKTSTPTRLHPFRDSRVQWARSIDWNLLLVFLAFLAFLILLVYVVFVSFVRLVVRLLLFSFSPLLFFSCRLMSFLVVDLNLWSRATSLTTSLTLTIHQLPLSAVLQATLAVCFSYLVLFQSRSRSCFICQLVIFKVDCVVAALATHAAYRTDSCRVVGCCWFLICRVLCREMESFVVEV